MSDTHSNSAATYATLTYAGTGKLGWRFRSLGAWLAAIFTLLIIATAVSGGRIASPAGWTAAALAAISVVVTLVLTVRWGREEPIEWPGEEHPIDIDSLSPELRDAWEFATPKKGSYAHIQLVRAGRFSEALGRSVHYGRTGVRVAFLDAIGKGHFLAWLAFVRPASEFEGHTFEFAAPMILPMYGLFAVLPIAAAIQFYGAQRRTEAQYELLCRLSSVAAADVATSAESD